MIVVVTRHLGAVDWLIRHEIIPNDATEVSVIEHATPADVTGQVVYGVLPLHLAALAKEVHSIDIPNLPADKRGKELTADDMDTLGASIVSYKVLPMEDWVAIREEIKALDDNLAWVQQKLEEEKEWD